MCLLVTCTDDLLALLERCKAGLKPGGMIVIKENVCERGFVVDPVRPSLASCISACMDQKLLCLALFWLALLHSDKCSECNFQWIVIR